jgi:cytochrome c oxidase subunit II
VKHSELAASTGEGNVQPTLRLLWIASWTGWVQSATADWAIDLPTPKSDVAARIYDLHILILLICLGIFVVVFSAMFYALFRHRKSAGHQARQFHESASVEVIWTLVPLLILVGMAWPATRVILEQKDTANPDLTIKITGYQWKWEYDYLQDGVKFMSVSTTPPDQIANQAAKGAHYLLEVDEPMVVPAGEKVRLLLTSHDVIHAWWVPALGVKQDAIPGFIRDTWFRASEPGTYRGQCAELCGRGHAFMPIVVEAKNPADYQIWLAAKQADNQARTVAAAAGKSYSPAELKARGEKVYAAHCAVCHQANGQGLADVFPALAGSKLVNGPAATHIDLVMHGKNGTAMTAFAAQLDDLELAAVITYERSAWGNRGTPVQPADVKARRK